jgi:hypothetical protein
MLDKINTFLQERKKWIKAGKPYRNEEKIKELFNICSSNDCQNYILSSNNEGNCNLCGCRLTPNKEYFNKLAWATTNCPLESPKWGPEQDYINYKTTEEIQEENEIIPPEPPPAEKRGGCGCNG